MKTFQGKNKKIVKLSFGPTKIRFFLPTMFYFYAVGDKLEIISLDKHINFIFTSDCILFIEEKNLKSLQPFIFLLKRIHQHNQSSPRKWNLLILSNCWKINMQIFWLFCEWNIIKYSLISNFITTFFANVMSNLFWRQNKKKLGLWLKFTSIITNSLFIRKLRLKKTFMDTA